jgi:hypothetical protein
MASVSNKRWQILAGWNAVADPSQGVLLDSSAIIAHFRGGPAKAPGENPRFDEGGGLDFA